MRVLSVTAQKPCSTGSGVYLTEVVRSLAKMGVSQAVVAGVTREDRVDMPEGVTVYPVYFSSEKHSHFLLRECRMRCLIPVQDIGI